MLLSISNMRLSHFHARYKLKKRKAKDMTREIRQLLNFEQQLILAEIIFSNQDALGRIAVKKPLQKRIIQNEMD